MTPKEIMKMEPEARLALEARARAGDVESVKDFVLSSVWRSLLGSKDTDAKEKVKAFLAIFKSVEINVEAA